MNQLEYLSDKELIKILIREKSNGFVAETLTNEFNTLPDLLLNTHEEELIKIKGVGANRAKQLMAVAELAKRLYKIDTSRNKYKICSPSDAASLLMNDMRYLKREELRIIMLNTKNEVIASEIISVGSLNSSIVHPREVFIKAVKCSSASIVVLHNHPSGDPSPSSEDINITSRLKECGKLLGIDVLDHIIIGDGRYISLKEKGIL
jgi:DNA repair protein RadC